MKIYVDEKNQDVRIDFGGEKYARVKNNRLTPTPNFKEAHEVKKYTREIPFTCGSDKSRFTQGVSS